MKKILLVGSQHGNEKLGEKLYAYLSRYHHDLIASVDFIIGNPRAHAEGIRYTESDMNRSYSSDMHTYESTQALQLLDTIRNGSYDVVLDLHTTRCVQPPSIIVSRPDHNAMAFIGSSSIEYVVYMKAAIAEHSLIGKNTSTVAIEVQDDTVSNELLESLSADIRSYFTETVSNKDKKTFRVTDFLHKNEIDPKDALRLQNFVKSEAGYYPFLVGENSYKKQTDYLGFKTVRT